MAHPGGRPMKFKSVEELQSKIDEYFRITPEIDVTITGLAIHLDTTRDLLCDYEDLEKYSDTIKKAKMRVKLSYEKSLKKRGNAGDIFALKNFGWKDKQEIDANITGNLDLGSAFREIKE